MAFPKIQELANAMAKARSDIEDYKLVGGPYDGVSWPYNPDSTAIEVRVFVEYRYKINRDTKELIYISTHKEENK